MKSQGNYSLMMKYISYVDPDGRKGFGATDGIDVYELRGEWLDLSHIASSVGFDQLLIGGRTSLQLSDVSLQPPLSRPSKLFGVGKNFPDNSGELASSPAVGLSLFQRYIGSFVGHQENLVRPIESEQLDYEGEIALVVGRGGRRILEADAYDHIAAVTLCNDGTVQDWMSHAKTSVTQGKNWSRSGSMGPWLVPFSGPELLENVEITTRVNGEIRQQANSSQMLCSFRGILSYVSTFCELSPGDIILTGTPFGRGAQLDPPKWLMPGDSIEVSVSNLGVLANGVEDEIRN